MVGTSVSHGTCNPCPIHPDITVWNLWLLCGHVLCGGRPLFAFTYLPICNCSLMPLYVSRIDSKSSSWSSLSSDYTHKMVWLFIKCNNLYNSLFWLFKDWSGRIIEKHRWSIQGCGWRAYRWPRRDHHQKYHQRSCRDHSELWLEHCTNYRIIQSCIEG